MAPVLSVAEAAVAYRQVLPEAVAGAEAVEVAQTWQQNLLRKPLDPPVLAKGARFQLTCVKHQASPLEQVSHHPP